MVILSVDYGDMRTGVAVCDKLGMLASPVDVITGDYQPKIIDAVIQRAKQYSAEKIVVGLPKNMDGSEGERAVKCKEFAQALQEKSGIETVMFDERLTTVSAHRALSFNNVTGKKRKAVVDAVSAVIILEAYLAANK